MALPLPTLTWVQSARQTVAGAGSPTDQQMLDALSTLLSGATYWEVKSSAAGYLQIGPKSGSNIAQFRAIVGDDPAGDYAVNAATATGIYVGVAPDGGTLGTWNGGDPFQGERWSSFWHTGCPSVLLEMYIVESDEQLWVFGENGGNKYGFGIGAVLEGVDAASVESDDRLYGMFTSKQGGEISNDFLSINNDFLTHQSSTNSHHAGIFKPGVDTFLKLERIQTTVVTDGSSSMVSKGGSLVSVPLHFRTDNDGGYYVGRLRQIRATNNFATRAVIADGVPTTKGYVFSSVNAPSVNDAILFGNS